MNTSNAQPDLLTAVLPDLIKGLPAAFVALVIGCVAAGIAWRQFKVAQAKLNLDLFEHRYEVYEVVWSYLSARRESIPEIERNFNNSIPKAEFLFGKEIALFMTSAIQRSYDIRSAERVLANTGIGDPLRRQRESEIVAMLNQWDLEMTKLRERFGPYMNFSEWR